MTNVTVTPSYTTTGGSQIVVTATGNISTSILKVDRLFRPQIDVVLDRQVGQRAAARRARARQHRLDVEREQDDRAENRQQDRCLTQLKDAARRPATSMSRSSRSARTSTSTRSTTTRTGSSGRAPTTWDENNGNCKNYSGQQSAKEQDELPQQKRQVDAEKPQHLERLRHRPRPGLRHQEHRALARQPGDAVSGRAIRHMPGAADGAELRLDGAEQEDRRHAAGRQHQPGDRPAVGLPVLDGRALHHSAEGFELHLQGSHHPAHRRPQHRGPLVQQRIADRRAPEDHLRQRQGCRELRSTRSRSTRPAIRRRHC